MSRMYSRWFLVLVAIFCVGLLVPLPLFGAGAQKEMTDYSELSVPAKDDKFWIRDNSTGTLKYIEVENLFGYKDARGYALSESGTAAANATALQEAIDSLTSGYGTVKIPTGSYDCNPITIDQSHVTLKGMGYKETKLNYSGTSTFLSVNEGYCLIEGIFFQGPDGDAGNGDIGLSIANAKREVVTRDCTFYQWDTAYKDDGFSNAIEDCGISDFKTYGMKIDAVSTGYAQGVYIVGTAAQGKCVYVDATDYEFYSCTFSSSDYGAHIAAANAVSFIGCHFEDPTTWDIYSGDPSNCTIIVQGSRLQGKLRSASSEGNGTLFILDGNRFSDSGGIEDNADSRWYMKANTGLLESDFATGSGEQHWLDEETETVTAASPTLTIHGGTALDSTSTAITATLGDGHYIGQLKTIVMTDASNSSTVSATHHETSDPKVATFDAVDEYWLLVWTGTEWATVSNTCTFL